MSLKLRSVFDFFLTIEKQERLKVFLLSLSFFFVIGGYTIVKELKDSIFSNVVGSEYVPKAKIFSMLLLIPCILLYSYLVDLLKRHQLLIFYAFLYSIAGLIFAYFLAHPTIGLANVEPSKDRIFGWLFYFFMEGYSPFVVSVFWAFASSITTPESAKNNFGFMVAGSKLGGILSAGLAWWILTFKGNFYGYVLSDVLSHQILLTYASCCLLAVPLVIYVLTRKVSAHSLHGYEATYRADKKDEILAKKHPNQHSTGIFSGLILLFKNPYMLGIFATTFFYEIINIILQMKRLEIFGKESESIKDFSASLYEQRISVHAVSLVISLIGTRTLMKLLGERLCLLLVPLLTGLLVAYFLLSGSREAVLYSFIILSAVHYAFASPLKESLYIPTVKELRFKSKSWIDAFGGKFSKACGSLYKDFSSRFAATPFTADTIFFSALIMLWLITAYFLGRRYEQATKNNEVIGA